MATITNTIRWATNVEELKRNLKDGLNQIEATRAGAEKMVQALGGDKLIAAAHKYAAAVQEIGGAAKLTTGEQERVNAVVTKAIEKYQALGQTAPTALRELAAATKQASTAGDLLASTFGQVFAGFTAANLFNRAVGTLTDFGREALTTASTLVDLSNKTGLSTETLQRMQFVAKQSGTEMTVFADAAFKMGVNVSEGTKKARDGAESLGLSWKDLRAASPDAQFNMVVQALERMEDPQKRNEAAVALFGKTAKEILPAIVDGYTKVANEATVAGDAQVHAIDALGDAWDRWKQRTTTSFVNVLGSMALIREATSGLTDAEKAFVLQTMQGEKSLEAYDAALIRFYLAKRKAKDIALAPETSPVSASFAADLKKAEAGWAALTASEREEVFTALQLNKSNDDIINSLNITEGVLTVGKKAYAEHTQALSKATEAAKKHAEALEHIRIMTGGYGTALHDLGAPLSALIQADLKHGAAVADVAEKYHVAQTSVEELAKQLKFADAAAEATTKAFGGQLAMLTPLTERVGALHDSLHTLVGTWNTFHDGITVAGDTMATVTIPLFSTLPNVVAQNTKAIADATQKNLSYASSLKAIFSGHFASGFTDLGAMLKGALNVSSILNTMIGTGLSGLISGGLSLAMKGIGALFHGLFGGASKEELAGRDAVKAFEQQLAATLTTTQKLEAGGQSWKMTAIGVRDAYLAAGKSAAEAEAAVQKLWASSKLGAEATKAAIEEINGVLEDQKQDQVDLEAAIQRYGFSIEQLGPAMQKQKLGDQAKQLLNDWRLLVGSGISIVDVDQKMAASINDYLKLARQTGQEVPASFKPILQTMIDNGTLTDDAGNAITDMGQLGVTWAETMTAGFDRVVNKLQQLLEGLNLVPKALDNIPSQKDITITPRMGIPVEEGGIAGPRGEAASGGLVTAFGIQRFALGGRVPWTLAPIGTDSVPAMLTPGELILNQGQQAQIAALLDRGVALAQGLSGGARGASIVFNNSFAFSVDAIDVADFQQTVEKKIMPEMLRQFEDRTRGCTSRLQLALGLA